MSNLVNPRWGAGANVCIFQPFQWTNGWTGRTWTPPTPASYMAELASADGLNPAVTARKLPTQTEYEALIKNAGGQGAAAFLKKNGFSVPDSIFLYYDTEGHDPGGIYSTADSSFAPWAGAEMLGHMQAASPITCYLGSGAYKGIGTTCGTAWLDQRWPAVPPSPASPVAYYTLPSGGPPPNRGR